MRPMAWVAILALMLAPWAVWANDIAFACQTLEATFGRGAFVSIPGDWNGDGRPDLAASFVESDTLAIFLNRGDRRFELVSEPPVGRVPRGLAAGDVDGDGNLDLVVAAASSFDVRVLRGDGAGGFQEHLRLRESFYAPFHPLLEDVDRDGRLDLLVVNECNWPDAQRPGKLALLRGTTEGGFSPWAELPAGSAPSFAVWVDVDRHHGKDLLVANWRSQDLSLLLRQAGAKFAPERRLSIPGASPIYALATLDYDRDGAIDVATTDLDGRVHLLRGGKDLLAFDRSLITAGAGTRDIDAADLDGDGFVDLVTADQKADGLSWFRGTPNGAFAAAIRLRVGSRPRSVSVVDLDADGHLDLVVANQGAASLSILYGGAAKSVACGAGRPLD